MAPPNSMLHWSSLAVLAAGLLSVGPAGIRAQDSTVVCLSSFEWMYNSRSQNPCAVAAYLSAACTGIHGTVYVAPSSDPCQCSTVTYSMVSACGLCQNSSIISWSSWSFNCTTVYPEIFPPGIPDGTAVPHWAYQNVTGTTFNVTLAQSIGDNPESTPTVPQSTASFVSTSTSPLPISISILSSPSILPMGSSSNTNTGAIVGGVVGGVAGVALITAVVVFFVMRKRRLQIPPSAQFSDHPPPANPSSGYALQMTQPKFYDPSDPSTFPVSPPPLITTTGSANVLTSFVTYSNSSLRPGTGGAYTGMPEV